MNDLFKLVAKQLRLEIYDPQLPLHIHYSTGEQTAEVVISQPKEGGEKAIKILTRSLTATEVKANSELEKALSILHWGVKKAAKYTAYHTLPIVVMLRQPEHLLLVRDAASSVRLRAKVLDLQSYGVTFEVR